MKVRWGAKRANESVVQVVPSILIAFSSTVELQVGKNNFQRPNT
jgi:hypothetical protein